MQLYAMTKEGKRSWSGQATSFVRQLNIYGFSRQRVEETFALSSAAVYYHPYFCRSGYSKMKRLSKKQQKTGLSPSSRLPSNGGAGTVSAPPIVVSTDAYDSDSTIEYSVEEKPVHDSAEVAENKSELGTAMEALFGDVATSEWDGEHANSGVSGLKEDVCSGPGLGMEETSVCMEENVWFGTCSFFSAEPAPSRPQRTCLHQSVLNYVIEDEDRGEDTDHLLCPYSPLGGV